MYVCVNVLLDSPISQEERHKQLMDAYDGMPKSARRPMYTKRILDVVKQVKKQKIDIERILADTRALQKEINEVRVAGGCALVFRSVCSRLLTSCCIVRLACRFRTS